MCQSGMFTRFAHSLCRFAFKVPTGQFFWHFWRSRYIYICAVYIHYIYIHVYILVYIIEFMDSMNQMVQMKVMKGQTGWGPIYWLTGLLRFRLVVQEWRTAIYELANESRGRGPGGEGPCHGHGHGCRHRVICCAKNLSTLSQLWVPCSPCSDGIVMVLYMLTFKSITKNIYMTQI